MSHEFVATPLANSTQVLCILGRQPELSLAELEGVGTLKNITRFSEESAVMDTDVAFDIQRYGGIMKAGYVVAEIDRADWLAVSKQLVQHYLQHFQGIDAKVTIGISVYGRPVQPRDIQKTGLTLKSALKKRGQSMRLIPNDTSALSTATSHHNKLGLSATKLEILIVFGRHSVVIAESVGAQNITALAKRDQGRPKRDAFVGMLPPKLALMMVNMSGALPYSSANKNVILDPFCGTGVVLQEAALLGYATYGSDLSEKMVDYSTQNMQWLASMHAIANVQVEAGDAIEHTWTETNNLAAVVCETYLGQPFSAPPAPDKLEKVVRVCNDIISKFLSNIASQLEPGTPLCLAVPAWRSESGWVTFLPVLKTIESLGYTWQTRTTVDAQKLLYYREDQVVARQLLLITKS